MDRSPRPAGLTECTEQKRLNDAREEGIPWKKWGPYLSERQWGTVREDYSEDGNAWDYFTHEQSRSRALIRALLNLYAFYGDDFTVECPTGSGRRMTLFEVAKEISRRLTAIFLRDENGRRPVYGGTEKFQADPHWRDLILFYEYFHGDNGAGLGASHQTGWTGIVARLLDMFGRLDAQTVLRKAKGQVLSEMVRQQVGGS